MALPAAANVAHAPAKPLLELAAKRISFADRLARFIQAQKLNRRLLDSTVETSVKTGCTLEFRLFLLHKKKRHRVRPLQLRPLHRDVLPAIQHLTESHS